MQAVFDRFAQADGSFTRVHSGLGLGMAIVRHLVELHGGLVTAASDGKDQGAAFTVTLPIGASPGWETVPKPGRLAPLAIDAVAAALRSGTPIADAAETRSRARSGARREAAGRAAVVMPEASSDAAPARGRRVHAAATGSAERRDAATRPRRKPQTR
jgi:hypothetical protein